MNKTDVETLILRDLESNDIDQLWESIENDLKDLPSSWPVNKRFFTEWLLENVLSEFPTKYIIEYKSDQGIKTIAGIISVDIITNQNQINYQMADQGHADVTYMTFSKYSGLGVATFAVQQISKILINSKFNPTLRIANWNKASARVAIKCGYIKYDSSELKDGYFDDELSITDVYRKIRI